MLNALLGVANHGLAIGVLFTIVVAAFVFIETPRQRRAVSVRAKFDSEEERATALEEVAVQRMIDRVKSALEAAEKKRMVRVKSEALVSDQVSGLRDGLSQTDGQERLDREQIAPLVEPHPRRSRHPMLWPLAVHRMLTHTVTADGRPAVALRQLQWKHAKRPDGSGVAMTNPYVQAPAGPARQGAASQPDCTRCR
jgi:hypothetical protein